MGRPKGSVNRSRGERSERDALRDMVADGTITSKQGVDIVGGETQISDVPYDGRGRLSTWRGRLKRVEDVVEELGGIEDFMVSLTTHIADGGGVMEFVEHHFCTYGALMGMIRADMALSRRYDTALQDRKGRDAERVRALWSEVMDIEARDAPSWTEKLNGSEKMAKASGLLRDGPAMEYGPQMSEREIREQLAELLKANPDVRRQLLDSGVVDAEVLGETAQGRH